jgi:hypothetical protein
MASLGAFIKLFTEPPSPAEFIEAPKSVEGGVNLLALANATPRGETPAGADPYGLTGAQISPQRSQYEPTLAPGETRTADDLRSMLGEVILAAGAGASPVTGPRGVELARTAARVRPGGEAAFNKWFEGSKIVEPTGEPTTVYHGTSKPFDSFNMSLRGENAAHPSANLGIFFAKDPVIASDFASRQGGNVKPVHLKMTNPLVIEAKDFASDLDFWQGMKGVPGRRGNESQYDRSREYFERMRETAQDAGHDGIVIRGNKEMAKDYPELVKDNYVVFESNQIKSATGNRGTYNPASGDIRE